MMTELKENNIRQLPRKRSIFFPLLLILLGLIFLLSNMNLLPGDAKTLILRFWPLLFVLGGVEDLFNSKWVGAVLNVGIGIILLLANLGYFPWSAWQMIWKLWPVFIIALGLEIAFHGQSLIGSLIGVTLSVIIVAAILWFALNSSIVGIGTSQSIQYDLMNAKQAEIMLKPAISNLEIKGGSMNQQLLQGEVSLAKEEMLRQDYQVVEGVGKLNLSSEGTVVFPSRTTNNGFPWILKINDDLLMNLEVDQGVGQQKLDLSRLNLPDFKINLGVGSMEIILPAEEAFNGKIECGIGEMIVRVPKGISLKIKLDSAISSTEFPDNYSKQGEWIYSPGAESDVNASMLEISNPIGSIKILSQ